MACPQMSPVPGTEATPAAWGGPVAINAPAGGFGQAPPPEPPDDPPGDPIDLPDLPLPRPGEPRPRPGEPRPRPAEPRPRPIHQHAMLAGLVPPPPGASVSVRCGDASLHPATITSWTDRSVSVILPAKPAGCDGPLRLVVVIPRLTGGPDVCEVPLFVASPPVIVDPPRPDPAGTLIKVAIFFENVGFSGRMLVAVPKDSPLRSLDGSSIVGALLGAPALPKLPALGGVVKDVVEASLLNAVPNRTAFFVRANEANQITDFWDYEYQGWPARVSAEDIFSSFIVIGPEGTRLLVFNAPDCDDREGSLEVRVGQEGVVRCTSLVRSGRSVGSVPARRVTVHRRPDFWKGLFNVKTFDNEFSSLQFR